MTELCKECKKIKKSVYADYLGPIVRFQDQVTDITQSMKGNVQNWGGPHDEVVEDRFPALKNTLQVLQGEFKRLEKELKGIYKR